MAFLWVPITQNESRALPNQHKAWHCQNLEVQLACALEHYPRVSLFFVGFESSFCRWIGDAPMKVQKMLFLLFFLFPYTYHFIFLHKLFHKSMIQMRCKSSIYSLIFEGFWPFLLYLCRYREWGWEIFKAFEKYTKVGSGGYTSLDDVTVLPPRRRDKMETFFLGETLKYLYLLFGDKTVIALDEFVFNTEAHPFPIIKGSSGMEWHLYRCRSIFTVWSITVHLCTAQNEKWATICHIFNVQCGSRGSLAIIFKTITGGPPFDRFLVQLIWINSYHAEKPNGKYFGIFCLFQLEWQFCMLRRYSVRI